MPPSDPAPQTILSNFRAHQPRQDLYEMPNRAAVLIPLMQSDDGELHVLLTLRSKDLRKHGGEVSLPGGRYEEGDKDLVATSLREANEEIGLPVESVQVLTTLHVFVSRFHLLVTPVVGVIPSDFKPVPNPSEVAECFSVPLRRFVMPEDHGSVDIEWEGMPYRAHWFIHDNYKIWGLTAEILIEAARIAYGDPTAFDVHGPNQPTMEEGIEHLSKLGRFPKGIKL
ncbi:hypothetical protein HK104_009573 [Borealophlyctis nickersoniae]|nr:hypothetical protein HK104_009573 [Borealophlyctis nickersoniae]